MLGRHTLRGQDIAEVAHTVVTGARTLGEGLMSKGFVGRCEDGIAVDEQAMENDEFC